MTLRYHFASLSSLKSVNGTVYFWFSSSFLQYPLTLVPVKKSIEFGRNIDLNVAKTWWNLSKGSRILINRPGNCNRHSDVITMMTSSKSVKIENCYYFSIECPLIKIDPSFFLFWVALSDKTHIGGVRYERRKNLLTSALLYYRSAMMSYWSHNAGCRIFLSRPIKIINIQLLSKFEDDW